MYVFFSFDATFLVNKDVYCTEHASLIWNPLTNACRNNDMAELGQLRSQWFFQFVQISKYTPYMQSQQITER